MSYSINTTLLTISDPSISIYGIARATADEIAEVAGVNATVAAEVRRVASSAASERT